MLIAGIVLLCVSISVLYNSIVVFIDGIEGVEPMVAIKYSIVFFLIGILLFLVGILLIVRKRTKIVAEIRQETQLKKAREQSKLLREELCSLYPIDYAQIVENSEFETYEEVVESHIKRIFTEENTKKYQELSDGISTGWDRRKQELEQLILILNQHKEIREHMNIALTHMKKGRWNKCNANLRIVLEWLICAKVDSSNTLFDDDNLPSLGKLINRFYPNYDEDWIIQRKDIHIWDFQYWEIWDNGNFGLNREIGIYNSYMRKVCQSGNDSLHSFENNGMTQSDFESCRLNMTAMEHIIVFIYNNGLKRYFEEGDLDVKNYFGEIEDLINEGLWRDVATSIRISLETLVKGYFKKYKVRCMCGYPKKLEGYIDLLCFQKYISEGTKDNMHKLRVMTNPGAHLETSKDNICEENMLMCFDILKKEVEIYENIIVGEGL